MDNRFTIEREYYTFKSRLENYREFSKLGNVKGLGGKRISAHGIGSVTLIDLNDNKYTLKDVLYVSESAESIISLMKIRKSDFNFQFLDDPHDGDFILSSKTNSFKIIGYAINDICYINEGRITPQTLTVQTRSSFKRDSPISISESSNHAASMKIYQLRYQHQQPAIQLISGVFVSSMSHHQVYRKFDPSNLHSIPSIVLPVFAPSITNNHFILLLQRRSKRVSLFTLILQVHLSSLKANRSMSLPSSMISPISVGLRQFPIRSPLQFAMQS
jgi:hypothetical protein